MMCKIELVALKDALKGHELFWGFKTVLMHCNTAYVTEWLPSPLITQLTVKGLTVIKVVGDRTSMGRIVGRQNRIGVIGHA